MGSNQANQANEANQSTCVIPGLLFKDFDKPSTNALFKVNMSNDFLNSVFDVAKNSTFSKMTIGKFNNDEKEIIDDEIIHKASTEESVSRHMDESVRVSEISNTRFNFKMSIEEGLGDHEELTAFSEEFEFLRYNVGGHFDVHIDRTRYSGHTHTVCIYPPQNIEGGELVLYRSPSETEVKMSPDSWVVVVFPIEMPHAAKPVTNGKKYMFKGTCSLNYISARPYGDLRFSMGYDANTYGIRCD
jgi:hypothetical protein